MKSNLICILTTYLLINVNAKEIIYQPTDEDFPNPERGFYVQKSVSQNAIEDARSDDNITVLRTYFRIDDWIHTPLPQTFLDDLDNDLNTVRQGGAKIIPRFSYNFGRDGTDAPLEQILAHIEQVGPILARHADIIAFLEAGFIGAWGEWHSSDFNLDNTEARQTVLFKLLEVLPEDKFVTLRYAHHKRDIFESTEPLQITNAFKGSPIARTGAINDCLGASVGNWGTYENPDDSENLEWQKNFLNQDNRFVPQGGETCNVSEYSTCGPVLEDMERMRWDVINNGFHGGVLQSWRDGGCFEEIKRNLGHRLSLVSASLADSVHPNGYYSGNFRITNTGWGKVYNPRHVVLVFRHSITGDEFSVPIHRNHEPAADPRYWLKGDTVTFSFSVPLPGAEEGLYNLFLNLPDTAATLKSRPEYSIRLANLDMHEGSTGYNNLNHQVTLSDVAPLAVNGRAQENSDVVRLQDRSGSGIRFKLNLSPRENYSLEIRNLSGKKIWGRRFNADAEGAVEFAWRPNVFSPGVHILLIIGRNADHFHRFTLM